MVECFFEQDENIILVNDSLRPVFDLETGIGDEIEKRVPQHIVRDLKSQSRWNEFLEPFSLDANIVYSTTDMANIVQEKLNEHFDYSILILRRGLFLYKAAKAISDNVLFLNPHSKRDLRRVQEICEGKKTIALDEELFQGENVKKVKEWVHTKFLSFVHGMPHAANYPDYVVFDRKKEGFKYAFIPLDEAFIRSYRPTQFEILKWFCKEEGIKDAPLRKIERMTYNWKRRE